MTSLLLVAFLACRPGLIVNIPLSARPIWRAEGFVLQVEAEQFAHEHPEAKIIELLKGAHRPWIVLWKVTEYLGPTHWPVKTYSGDELQEAFGDVRLHELFQEPWGILSTGDPNWPMAIVFEASSPCPTPKRRGV